MKKILLLGDSIRMNYGPYVFKELNSRAEITAPEENCRFAKYTLATFSEWIRVFGNPDIIHWNNGIWDASDFGTGECLTSVEEYKKDMLGIYKLCRQTGAKIIFATCTPCKPHAPQQKNEDIERYNNAALEVLKDKVDEINDLRALIESDMDKYICEDGLHLSKDGISAAGKQVVSILEKYL